MGDDGATSIVFVPFGIAAQDFDHDGKLDLVVGENNVAAPSLHYFAGKGAGSFSPDQKRNALRVVDLVAVDLNGDGSVITADFDGDGKPDLATANYTANDVTVLSNTSH